jgi:cytidylate kinase
MSQEEIIAIDGPAASGKSTVAEMVAATLDIPYINTGNMYRAITLAAMNAGIALDTDCTESALTPVLDCINMDYEKTSDDVYEIKLDGQFPGQKIREPQVASYVSPVAALPCVRSWLKDKQRSFSKLGLIVMEGRDIGTEIFPGAKYKFFLTASPEERARRRLGQDGENFDGATLESVAKAIAERDRIDSTRAVAPLRPAEDAEIVDTSEMTIKQVVEYIVEKVKNVSA